MQISTLLRPKHCLRSHIESTSRNEFERRFLHFLANLRATMGSVSSLRASSPIWATEASLARLLSLAKIGELARRLDTDTLKGHSQQWDRADLDTTFASLTRRIHLEIRFNLA